MSNDEDGGDDVDEEEVKMTANETILKSIFQLDLRTVSFSQMVQGKIARILNHIFSKRSCLHLSDILMQYICVRLKGRNMHSDEFDLIHILYFCVTLDFQYQFDKNIYFFDISDFQFDKTYFLRPLRFTI